jgi:hypothetical protein
MFNTYFSSTATLVSANALRCYVIRTQPVLLMSNFSKKIFFFESYVSPFIYEYIKFEARNHAEEWLLLPLTPSRTVILLLMMTGNYKTWLSDGSKRSDVHINLLHRAECCTS